MAILSTSKKNSPPTMQTKKSKGDEKKIENYFASIVRHIIKICPKLAAKKAKKKEANMVVVDASLSNNKEC